MGGGLEEVDMKFIVRGFDTPTLRALEEELKNITAAVVSQYNKSSFEFTVIEQYRNMKEVLDTCPQVINYAQEAIRRAGVTPLLDSIRGGTDGARFSFMGLPTANIFAAQHGIHSKQEWISIQDMHKAVQTVVNIVQIWEENA